MKEPLGRAWSRLVDWDTQLILRVFPGLSPTKVATYQRITSRLAIVGVILIALGLPLAIWGPFPFMMSWWHLRHDAKVSWRILEIDVPRPWFVWEKKSDDTVLTIVRSPDADHFITFGPHTPKFDSHVRGFESNEALIEDMEKGRPGSVTRHAIDGRLALRQDLLDSPPGRVMEHWILPEIGYDFVYTRTDGETPRIHELTDRMLLKPDGVRSASR